MSLDNFQRKENTDSSLNTSKEATKEATKETQNSLNSLKKEIISGDVKQTDKQRPQPTQAPSTNSEKSDNWLVNKMVSGAKEAASTMVSGARETVSTMVSGARETVSTIADKISTAVDNTSELLWSVSRLVSIDGFPPKQIPILKATLEWWQKLFDKLYEFGWEWIGKTIDCSHLVSFALRAGGILMPNQYLNSTALYQKFSGNKIAKQSTRAGDLMFWGKWGGWHVEIVVWKPYQKEKNGKWYVKTLWSSKDTTGTSPMYNIDGTPSTKYNGVAYRERVIIQGKHQFLRPQYEKLVAENQKKKK